jgi:hypothetical protein
MNRVAGETIDKTLAARGSIDIAALRRAPVQHAPFPFLIVPGFVKREALGPIGADFPVIAHAGSFPLPSLRYGPAFRAFADDLQGPDMRDAVSAKLGLDLRAHPTMITVRGMSKAADGKIHTDSKTKLVTALIYMNDAWESPKGRLRLVRSAHDLDDVIAEVPPDAGTLLLFKNQHNAWHGFEPYSGPRRVVQLNWVTDARVVAREETRHRISAFLKRLRRR